MIRLAFGLLVVISLLIYAIFHVVNHHYYLALALLLISVLAAWVCVIGLDGIFNSVLKDTLAGIIVLLSVAHVFSTSPASDLENAAVNIELMMQAMTINFCPQQVQKDQSKRAAFSKLKDVLFSKCIVQTHSDMMQMTVNLGKSIYLDPVSGTLDNIYSDFISEKQTTCRDVANEMNLLCPGQIHF